MKTCTTCTVDSPASRYGCKRRCRCDDAASEVDPVLEVKGSADLATRSDGDGSSSEKEQDDQGSDYECFHPYVDKRERAEREDAQSSDAQLGAEVTT